MRNTIPLMIAVALTAAAPAAAQGTDNSVNADTTAAATDNMTVTTDPAIVGSANDMTAAPTDQPIDSSYGEPAPAKKSGFPWGVVGVLGLLGLIPRKSR